MQRCKKCGYSIPDGSMICPACGANITEEQPSRGGKKKPENIPEKKPNAMLKYFDYMDNEMLYNFGVNARNGIGMEQDVDAAFKAFTALANRGDYDGMYKLAEMYEEKNPPQINKALIWLQLAAKGKHAPSRIKLRNMIANGVIDESDLDFEIESNKVSGNTEEENGATLYENCIGGVLEIYWQDQRAIYSGSGFLVSDDGYAITNTHVVTGENYTTCDRVEVHVAGEKCIAKVLAIGDNKGGLGKGVDLALIKLERVPKGSAPLKFADFDLVRNGDKVYVIGNSLGYGTCITSGIVSDKLRPVNGKELLMTDCATNHGNSGGPILNNKGLVIGAIVSGIESAEGMNFAIPAPQIREFIYRCKCGIEL